MHFYYSCIRINFFILKEVFLLKTKTIVVYILGISLRQCIICTELDTFLIFVQSFFISEIDYIMVRSHSPGLWSVIIGLVFLLYCCRSQTLAENLKNTVHSEMVRKLTGRLWSVFFSSMLNSIQVLHMYRCVIYRIKRT